MTESSKPDRQPHVQPERAGIARPTLGTVTVLNRDLMFGVRIGNQLRSLGYAVQFARDTDGFVDLLRTTLPAPVLGVIDMNNAIDWSQIQSLVADPAVATPLLAFGPHTDVAGRRTAKAAGVDRLVSNGDFHRDMVALVQRYAHSTPSGPAAEASG